MNARESVLVLLLVAAASVAAISFRVAVHPGEIHDPRHAARFEEAVASLPVLGAVRVRSRDPDAAERLAIAPGGAFSRILRPARAEAVFRRGRLLYASPAEVERVLRFLKQGELPDRLPPPPDITAYYRDARGPYACDVELREGRSVASIRKVLPDAHLDGEPVVREAESESTRGLARALLLALIAAGAWRAWRGGAGDVERRLLATLVPLALLGLSGWGVDRWTVGALALVAAAPRGLPLLAALPCLLFPSAALARIGLVLAAGGVVRWTPAVPRARSGGRAPALLLAVLLAGGWLLFRQLPLEADTPASLRGEPAVTFVPLEAAAERARALRAEGFLQVVGGTTPVPPRPTLETRRHLGRIYELATALARMSSGARAESFQEVADAAALDELYLPAELRARLRTTDGRAAVWVQDHVPPAREEFISARLYRARGEIQLRDEARLAGLAAFLLGALWLIWKHGDRALVPIAARFAGVGAAFWLLRAAEAGGAGLVAPVYLPLLVAAALVPSIGVVIALAAAAILAPPLLWAAAAFAVAGAGGWLGEFSRPRSPRSLLPSLPSPPRPPPAPRRRP